MNKPAFALMLGGCLALSAPLRAEDDGNEAPKGAASPAAAEAARDKGYKAEKANDAVPAIEEDESPIERHSQPKTSSATPPQRPLGEAERRVAASAGGETAPSASGISCDKSDPPLKRVIRVERDFYSRDLPNSGRWAVGPNEAISYKFTAPKSGMGGFSTDMGTNARIVPHMITVSEIPCDFDGVKAVSGRQVGPNEPRPKFVPCYEAAGGPGGTINFATIGLALPPGTPTVHICWVKPGKTYYFNIRTYLPFPDRDACAEEAKTFGPNLKCGGIWGFIGKEAASAVR